jgi:hypothetical protein
MTMSSSNRRKFRNFYYTVRDILFFYALMAARYMTTTQIFLLHWDDPPRDPQIALKDCQRRLRRYEKHNLVRRIKQATIPGTGSKPDLFKLAAGSIPLLEYECGVDPKSVDVEVWADEELSPKIKHILATTDVHIAFHRACQQSVYSLEEWTDESTLRNSPTKDTITISGPNGAETQTVIIPDAFFILNRDGKRGMYRLEVDRATVELEASREQKRSIAQKIKRYLLLEQSESYSSRYGTRPLQVLWAVKGERRMNNMMSVTDKVIAHFVQLPAETPTDEHQKQEYEKKLAECKRLQMRFLFTTLDAISQHNPINEPIWHVLGNDEPRTLAK